ncbi:MAG: hypothetical protein CFH37_01419 [Alphaproteobacteria bacterium MarineAlpha9_Bin7]|nr:MAG: hypothetical protein CFH37_01419 [Alphaproteobacteria bacterium MarineAlpha9_Bin7]
MDFHIVEVTLDEGSIVRWKPEIDRERRVAIYDLLEQNYFAPASGLLGPYKLHLEIQDSRLVFNIKSTHSGDATESVLLPFSGFRRVIKDYFTVCETYYEAIKHSPPRRIEALDLGRRSLHDEGSELLLERLKGKIDIDFSTARRLFTLLCVVQMRG